MLVGIVLAQIAGHTHTHTHTHAHTHTHTREKTATYSSDLHRKRSVRRRDNFAGAGGDLLLLLLLVSSRLPGDLYVCVSTLQQGDKAGPRGHHQILGGTASRNANRNVVACQVKTFLFCHLLPETPDLKFRRVHLPF